MLVYLPTNIYRASPIRIYEPFAHVVDERLHTIFRRCFFFLGERSHRTVRYLVACIVLAGVLMHSSPAQCDSLQIKCGILCIRVSGKYNFPGCCDFVHPPPTTFSEHLANRCSIVQKRVDVCYHSPRRCCHRVRHLLRFGDWRGKWCNYVLVPFRRRQFR